MRRTFLAAAMALTLLGVACANSSSGTGGGIGAGGRTYPTGADQLVVRISSGGGFIAPSYTVTQVPQFSLMGDGLAITPGAIPEIYPGPAIIPLFSQQLSPDAIQAILTLADKDGLLSASHNYTFMPVSDMPTTTITVVVDGQTHTLGFYALGQMNQKKPDGMSQAEFDARQKAEDFTKKLGDLSWLPTGSASASQPFAPTGVRVFVSDYKADPSMTEPEIAWPLSTALADFGSASGTTAGGAMGTRTDLPSRCGAVTGSDAATLLPLIAKANQLTPWKSQGHDYGLLFRPLLPDESGC